MMLTDPEFIRKLETLYLLTKKVLGGELKSDRRSAGKGSGLTFADYAEYHFGDDYRNIDWNIYARLEHMVIKLFEIEEDVRIFILLDMSPSMSNKILYAKRIAAALGYIALNNLDFLAIYGVADSLQCILQPSHGRGKIFPMLEALETAQVFGTESELTENIKSFQLKHRRPGICIIISDFFIRGGYKTAFDFLRWSGNDVFVIQILSPDELKCDLKGDIELECIESGRRKRENAK